MSHVTVIVIGSQFYGLEMDLKKKIKHVISIKFKIMIRRSPFEKIQYFDKFAI